MFRLDLAAIAVMLLIAPVAAFTITPTDIGGTYIVWNWTAGETTDIFIDGSVQCGYETTDPSYVLTGLKYDELHNITVFTATDSGTAWTRTLNCTALPSAPGCGNGTADFYAVEDAPSNPIVALAGIIFAAVLFGLWRVS